ncbi:hypothetical protein MJO29_010456, partial [Puccinia striiformis f. sp. tritici]
SLFVLVNLWFFNMDNSQVINPTPSTIPTTKNNEVIDFAEKDEVIDFDTGPVAGSGDELLPSAVTNLIQQHKKNAKPKVKPNHTISGPVTDPQFNPEYHTSCQSGTILTKGRWMDYSEWFDQKLPNQSKEIIRAEMSALPNRVGGIDGQDRGYLHCLKMKPTCQNCTIPVEDLTWIKVGRLIHPEERCIEWAKKCPSRHPIMCGIFPPFPIGSSEENCPPRVKYYQKWERLALQEPFVWAAFHSPYSSDIKFTCPDCGIVHSETFQLKRGSFEVIIKPLVEKWMTWSIPTTKNDDVINFTENKEVINFAEKDEVIDFEINTGPVAGTGDKHLSSAVTNPI